MIKKYTNQKKKKLWLRKGLGMQSQKKSIPQMHSQKKKMNRMDSVMGKESIRKMKRRRKK